MRDESNSTPLAYITEILMRFNAQDYSISPNIYFRTHGTLVLRLISGKENSGVGES